MNTYRMVHQLCTGGWEDTKSGVDISRAMTDTLNLLQWCGAMEGWGSLRICPDCEIVYLSRGNSKCLVCEGRLPKPVQNDRRKTAYITINGYRTHD